MVMRSRPTRRGESRGEERTAAFVEKVAEEETAQLHCLIPDELHHKLSVMAAQDRTTITALVIEALQQFVESRS